MVEKRERDAKTGQYVKKGTEQRKPDKTVTEPVKKNTGKGDSKSGAKSTGKKK